MCLNKILALFKKKSPPPPATTPTAGPASEPGHKPEPPPEPLSLPYPEEPPDQSRTVDNTDLDAVLDEWEIKYKVPESNRDYWKTRIAIKMDDTLPYPAGTYERDGVRHLNVRPPWANPGVIAHEQAHNSYALLTEAEKAEFSKVYGPLKTKDPLIVLLYSKNTYGLTSDIEGHAEVYRYLGDQMPEKLKRFYPKLF
jgi:hypothetical protein